MSEPTNETPEQIIEKFIAIGEREPEIVKELTALNAQLAPLNKRRDELLAENGRITKERNRLKKAFTTLTGKDLRKALRGATVEAIERAQGALNAAISAPTSLPLDHPVVVQRLADLRNAINVHRAAREKAKAEAAD